MKRNFPYEFILISSTDRNKARPSANLIDNLINEDDRPESLFKISGSKTEKPSSSLPWLLILDTQNILLH